MAFESTRLEQLGDMLTFCKCLRFLFYGTASFPFDTVFDVWGRLAETGSGNKSRLVAFESTRLVQRRGMLAFNNIMKIEVYYTANFPH